MPSNKKNWLSTSVGEAAGMHQSLTMLGRVAILVQLFRVGNSALLGSLAVFSVFVTKGGHRWTTLYLALLFTSWTALAATAYAINDLVDRVNDRVNRPERYLQQLDHTPFWIITSLCIVALTSALAGAFVPLDRFLVLELGWSCCAIGYSFGLKRRSGLLANVLTGFCVATSSAPGLLQGFSPRIFPLASVLFLLMLGREIWKDIEDEPGDIAAGLRTLPILRGSTFAARTASIMAATGFLVLILGRPSGHFVEMIAVSLGVFGFMGSVLLFAHPHSLPARKIQHLHRYAAIVVFAVFIIGSGIL